MQKLIPDISIVIVNYNVKDLVLQCLKTIYSKANESLLIETIVIDNASSDNSVEVIEKEFPQVKIIANKNNVGFPAANNQGFLLAKADKIFMLNPDTELVGDALLEMYKYMSAHQDVQLIAPMLLNSDKSIQKSVWRFPKVSYVFWESFHLSRFMSAKNYPDKDFSQPFEVDCFSGAAILFNKDILEKIGMLDETMFWIEDIEFCYRASKENMKRVYYPYAKVLHHIGQSAKKNYNISISNQVINKIKYFKKHHTKAEWILVVLISFLHVLMKIIVFVLVSPFNVVYFRKAKAYIYTLPLVFNPPLGMK